MDKTSSAQAVQAVAAGLSKKQKNLRLDIMRLANSQAAKAGGAQVSLGVPELAEKFNVSPEAVRSIMTRLTEEPESGYHRTSASLFVYRKVENRRKVPDRALSAKVLRYMRSVQPDEWVDAREVARALGSAVPSTSTCLNRLSQDERTHIIKLRPGSGLYSNSGPVTRYEGYTPPEEALPQPVEEPAAVTWEDPPPSTIGKVPPASPRHAAEPLRSMTELTGEQPGSGMPAEPWASGSTEEGSLKWVRMPSGKLLAEDDYGNLYELRKL